jgi:hypothetical protein
MDNFDVQKYTYSIIKYSKLVCRFFLDSKGMENTNIPDLQYQRLIHLHLRFISHGGSLKEMFMAIL